MEAIDFSCAAEYVNEPGIDKRGTNRASAAKRRPKKARHV